MPEHVEMAEALLAEFSLATRLSFTGNLST